MIETPIQNKGDSLPEKSEKREAFPIETGKLITVKTPDGLISETGVSELQCYMYEQGLGALPNDFEPSWVTNRGTLPKRISAHCYKAHNIKVTPEQISALGNIAKRNTSTSETFILDFTQKIDWNDGDFGDDGSCYWGSNSGAKDMLEANGAYAARLWKKRSDTSDVKLYGNVRGIGRAWLVKVENKLVLFNAYGPLTTLAFARVLSIHFACSYKRIRLTNNGTDGGTLYINGAPYAIGQWQEIQSFESHDFGWEEIERAARVYCVECDDCLGDEDDCDLPYALNRHGDSVACCDSCSFYCDRCETTYVRSIGTAVEGELYCRSCADELRDEIAQREADETESEASAGTWVTYIAECVQPESEAI